MNNIQQSDNNIQQSNSVSSIWTSHKHNNTRLMALCPGLPGWAGTRKVKPIWILLKQETVSGSGISWAVCKSAPCSRQINMPTPHHSVFYMPDALPAAQPTASKHWMHMQISLNNIKCRSLSMPKYYSLHKSALFQWGIWAPSIMWFLKTPRVHIPHTWLLKKNKQKETKWTGKNLRSSTHTPI